MSISNSYPTQRPVFSFNADAGKLDSRISFSRADTPPTYAAPSAVHYWSNEKHLSSENLLPYSNDLSQSVWTKRNLTVPATNIVAPDGTSSASSLLETSATSTHDFYEEFSAVSGTSYTFTLYAKANGRDTLHVSPQATSTIASVVFDLTAVTSTVISGSADSHSITAIGSTGWYKLQLTVTATASGTGFLQTYFRVGGVTSYAGDATKGAYIWGCQVSSTGETFLNATSGSIHRSFAPTLKSVTNAGDPRFEYDPASDGQSVGTALGLLVESSASNLQRYGSKFESWVGGSLAEVYADSAIAPNGQLEARLAVPLNAAGAKFLLDNTVSSYAGNTYTASVYAKSAGHRYVQLGFASGAFGTTKWATFDLEAGSVDANGVTASAVSVGNGWYRLSVTSAATSSAAHSAFISFVGTATAARNAAHVGDDFSGVLIWGYQYEEGSSASSLVNSGTSSSGVTRAADSCSVDLSQINYSGGEVTLVADTNTSAIDDYRQAASIIDDSQNQVTLYGNSYNNRLVAILGGGESSTLSQTSANGISALSFGVNDIAATRNGASPVTDTSQAFPNVSAGNLKIGGSGSSQMLNGTIKRIALFNVALSNVELQSLTSS